MIHGLKTIRYIFEGVLLTIIFYFFQALPFFMTSFIGGIILRFTGPLLPAHQLAKEQIMKALPDLKSKEVDQTLISMWWHLGRVAGEYPKLPKIRNPYSSKFIDIVGDQNISSAISDKNGAIFLSGHIGNWELIGNVLADYGANLGAVYRAPNNPIVKTIINNIRKKTITSMFPKGSSGAKGLIKHLKSHGQVCMLIDQRMNDGIAVPFFGKDAMTAPALAELALKYHCSVWPIRVERLKGVKYRITVYPQIKIKTSGNHKEDVKKIMQNANHILEEWIAERPDQWLWPHRRWRD